MRLSWLLLVVTMVITTAACRSPGDGTPAPSDASPPAAPDEGKASKGSMAEIATKPAPEPTPELLVPLDKPPEHAIDLEVQLPPGPKFSDAAIPERYDDGAYSVTGLRAYRDARLKEGEAGAEITVRAYVMEIYQPPECPEGELCPPPKQPHLWVTDAPGDTGKARAMMIVNYRFSIPEWDAKRWKGEPEIILNKGDQYTFKGKFKQFSDTGFAHAAGLLEFVGYKPHDPTSGAELPRWVHPPGAPWHPAEIARMEEENARLVEKARKSAK